jgi:hypothetical protein
MKKYYVTIIKHTSESGLLDTSESGLLDTTVIAEDFQFRAYSIVFYKDNEIVAVYPAVNTIIEKIEKIN